MFDKLKLTERVSDSGNATDASACHQAAAIATAGPLEKSSDRPAPAIPPELERAAADAGASIRCRFQSALSKPKALEIAARAFLRGLRGPRKKAGRKPYPSTTEAVRLLTGPELRDIPKSKRWPIIYKRVVPGYGDMPPEQAAGAAAVLRDRVSTALFG